MRAYFLWLLRTLRGEKVYRLRPGECLRNPAHGIPEGTILKSDGTPYLEKRND